MSWRDNLREGSFKGVPFKVESHEAAYNRRTVVNEYPFRDVPYTEDMGRSAKRWDVQAYIVGTDYMVGRDALLEVIEEGGAGSLIHPYLGTHRVICSDCRFRESQNDGGMVTFSLSFVEAGEQIFPNGDLIPSAQVESDADSLIDAIRTQFIGGITLTGVAEWVRNSYSGGLSSVADVFNDIKTVGGINNQSTTSLINQAADWVANVTELQNPALALIADVQATADKIISTFEGIIDLAPSFDDSSNNLVRFTDFSVSRATTTTEQAKIADANALELENFIKTVAVANESKAAVNRSYGSYEEAIDSRKAILGRIDTLAGETTNDTIYERYRSIRASVAAAIPSEETSLPRIRAVELKKTLPSLVLAYDLYEDVDKETDLIARNNIRHPGFMPGGQELNVLDYDQS